MQVRSLDCPWAYVPPRSCERAAGRRKVNRLSQGLLSTPAEGTAFIQAARNSDEARRKPREFSPFHLARMHRSIPLAPLNSAESTSMEGRMMAEPGYARRPGHREFDRKSFSAARAYVKVAVAGLKSPTRKTSIAERWSLFHDYKPPNGNLPRLRTARRQIGFYRSLYQDCCDSG